MTEKGTTQAGELGVRKGLHLKNFERALAKLLPHIEPRYMPLPPPPVSTTDSSLPAAPIKEEEKEEWPYWSQLPPAGRVYGSLLGQLSNRQRATRKEQQIQSMLRCIFPLLPTNVNDVAFTIVDFGGGSGHLSIPLALLLPTAMIITVDLKQKSLDFLHEKAGKCGAKNADGSSNTNRNSKNDLMQEEMLRGHLQETAIHNLWTFSGDIESFPIPFHIGVALHVCGEATDVFLRKCHQQKAHIVAAPCCVGKLNRQKKDPYIYHATTENTPTIQYPQSHLFQQCLQCSCTYIDDKNSKNVPVEEKTTVIHINMVDAANSWDALAKAADYSHELDMNNRRNAARRAAKGVLEMDRKLFLEQDCSYKAVLTRMEPLTASPKHDILLAYFCDGVESPLIPSSITTMMDEDHQFSDQVVEWTKEHLRSLSSSGKPTVGNESGVKQLENPRKRNKSDVLEVDSVDWTLEEEQTIRAQLLALFPSVAANLPSNTSNGNGDQKSNPGVFVFPTGMGGRKRKLIHYICEQVGLLHWSVGKKHAEKTVSVSRRCAAVSQGVGGATEPNSFLL